MTNPNQHSVITLNGTPFSKDKLILFAQEKLNTDLEQWEKDIYQFILEWYNEKDFIIAYTSGSTGTPKEIHLPKQTLIESAYNTINYLKLPQQASALLCIPAKYIGGKMMLVRSLIGSWHLDTIQPTSNPLTNLDKHYNFTAVTPQQIANCNIQDMDKIDCIIIGGGEVSQALENSICKAKSRLYSTYGMTETASHVALRNINKQEPYFEALENISFSQDDRNCLVVEAPSLLREKLITNDVVELLSPRQFIWKGRFDNVINTGGIKVHPEQVEKKLVPFISQRYFIHKLPDAQLGEKVILVVENKTPINIDLSQANLEFYEKPKQIFFIPKFMETDNGKIMRKDTLTKLI